ncbi:MAG: hypothetical protein PSY14_02495 [bacterium]|nr:hypothetical protein [bacterium]
MAEYDPLRPLQDKRRELTDRWLAFKTASRREGIQLGFWGGVGALAIAADLTLLGGLGTALAAMSGLSFVTYRREVKRLEKALKEVDRTITALQNERDDFERRNPTLKKGLEDEFSPAAKRKIEGLQARLDELEHSMNKLTGQAPAKPDIDAPDLGKPKYRPPAPPAI